MEEEGRTDKESPDEHLGGRSAQSGEKSLQNPPPSQHGDNQKERSEQIETIEKDKLGVLGQILDLGIVGWKITAAGNPAKVCPEKTLDHWGMKIFGLVRVLVVVAMDPSPPKGTPLGAGQAKKGCDKLPSPRNLKRLVAKVPVVEAGDKKHPRKIEEDSRTHRSPAPPRPERPETTEMEGEEGNEAAPLHTLRLVANNFWVALKIITIEKIDDAT